MSVYIFDQDALQKIAGVEHEILGYDPVRFQSTEYQSSLGSSSFKAFLDAWNQGEHDEAHQESDVFIPLESLPPSNNYSPSNAIIGSGGWHRYFVNGVTGEILFHLSFAQASEEQAVKVLEKYGFHTLGGSKP